jgi:hypothetical protein
MIAQQRSSTVRAYGRTHPVTMRGENHPELVPAGRVKELLREIAIAMHATQAVGWKGGARAPKKG